MGAMAAIIGGVGGLCAILGIITASGALEPLGAEFTWTFWFMLSGILLLICIAIGVGGKGGYD
jgi:hypothetical protein